MNMPTLAVAITEFMDFEKATKSHEKCYRDKHLRLLDAFCTHLGNPQVDLVVPSMIRYYFTACETQPILDLPDNYFVGNAELKPSYAEKTLHRFWTWVSEKYKLVPPMIIPTEDQLREAIQPLSEEEISSLIEKCELLDIENGDQQIPNPDCLRDKAMFLLMLEMGIYIYGITQILVEDLDFETKLLDLEQCIKHHEKAVELSTGTLNALRKYLDASSKEDSLHTYSNIFPVRDRNGQYLSGPFDLAGYLFGEKAKWHYLKRVHKTFALATLRSTTDINNIEDNLLSSYRGLEDAMRVYSLSEAEIETVMGKSLSTRSRYGFSTQENPMRNPYLNGTHLSDYLNI